MPKPPPTGCGRADRITGSPERPVLGSGIAGLSFALKVAPQGRVAIITKKDRAESNTNYAQGGIAAVTSKEDSVELHVQDTLQAGAGLCKTAKGYKAQAVPIRENSKHHASEKRSMGHLALAEARFYSSAAGTIYE